MADDLLLYRVMSFEQFVDTVASQRMYLTQLQRWDDTHEAETLRQLVRQFFDSSPDAARFSAQIKDQLLGVIHRSLYGQSWTILEESDAMWRIYSPDKMGIRITVRQPDVLARIQQTNFIKSEDTELYCGKVIYISAEEAWNQVQETLKRDGDSTPKTFANLCFFKRKQFSHEQEYRFAAFVPPADFFQRIQIDPAKPVEEGRVLNGIRELAFPPVYYYSIQPAMITQVTLDPRAPDWFVETVQNFFARYANPNLAQKSTLYSPPKV